MSDHIAPTRTGAFEARLRKRYAAERRFKALGLGAIVFSVAVLLFLLATMTLNGFGGFQRVEMDVPIDFAEAGIAVDPSMVGQPDAMQRLEAQGLPEVVSYFASEAAGDSAAAQIGPQAWRDVGNAILADPTILREARTFSLPVSADLASGYAGEGSAEMRALSRSKTKSPSVSIRAFSPVPMQPVRSRSESGVP
jgi:phosphate transport system permease protein